MRNVLLATALIAAPVAVFAAGYTILAPAGAPTATATADSPSLGDMTPFEAITTDVQSIATTGDLAAAKTRTKDLETAWDDAQSTLRPVNAEAWGHVDGTIDDALSALRATASDAAHIDATLAALQAALADPSAGISSAAGTPGTVSGIVVTDASGRALPCEMMLEQVRTALAGSDIAEADRAPATTLQAKATERCNADDDARSDAFSAQALAILPR